MKPKGISAWVVWWNLREDKVEKLTGTVVCLLPRRFSPKRVRDILDGIYLAYIKTFDGHLTYARHQTSHKPLLAELGRGSPSVFVGRNPGLHAALCTGVHVTSKKMSQTLFGTTPEIWRRDDRGSVVEKIPGDKLSYTFDFTTMKEVHSDLPKA
jgi:hypothetical protein